MKLTRDTFYRTFITFRIFGSANQRSRWHAMAEFLEHFAGSQVKSSRWHEDFGEQFITISILNVTKAYLLEMMKLKSPSPGMNKWYMRV